jgi:hypothetical protein
MQMSAEETAPLATAQAAHADIPHLESTSIHTAPNILGIKIAANASVKKSAEAAKIISNTKTRIGQEESLE